MKIDRPIEDLLDDLIRLGDAERATYLDDIRSEQPQLCERLERLLTAANNVGSFMEFDGSTSDSIQGAVIGSYVIREQIGEGGMGVVYVAEQTEPVQRKVALKIIKPGMNTKEVIARFEAERQALAFMEHPNIARVLDAGATNSGRSYFVMELVRGIPITEYCDQVKATPRERLELFRTVCDAVQHAHQKGIIHRDIKPSNVLVTQVGAKPVVKVIDFGLAKAISGQRLTEKTLYTGFMKLMGTPAYMSPEQAGLSGLDVDTRSDIYSLGVLLYELLTGTTPLDKTDIQKQAYDELCRQIREADAPKPSTRFSTLNDAQRITVAQQRQLEQNGLRQLLDGDLDHVVLKAIEKDRDRRYRSPQDLVEDIERFLDDKPVLAVPPSQWYLLRKYFRRHKVVILTTATVLSCLLVATAFSTWQAIVATRANKVAAEQTEAALLASQQANEQAKVAERERQIARDARREAIDSDQARRRLLYASNMQLADHLWNTGAGTPRRIQELLLAWIPTDEQPDLRDFAWRFQWNRLHFSAEQTVMNTQGVAFSPDGKLLVRDQQRIREWRDETQDFITCWSGSAIVALSPCGRWAVAQSENYQHLRLIDVVARKEIREVAGMKATFSANGEFVVVWKQSNKLVDYSVYKMGTVVDGSFTRTFRGKSTWLVPTLSADGESIAIPYERDQWLAVHRWGQPEPLHLHCRAQYHCATWSPDGQLFASGHTARVIQLRFADDLRQMHVFKSTRAQVSAVAFSRDSKQIAVGCYDGTVEVYDVSHIHAAATSPALTSNEATKSIKTMESPRLISSLNAHINPVREVVFSHDGSGLATRASKGTAKVWRLNGNSALLPSVALSEFPNSGRIRSWWEDTPEGVRLRKHELKPEHKINGQLNVGDRITAISDENGYHVIDESTDSNAVDRLLRGKPDSVVEMHLIDRGSNEHIVRQKRQLHPKIPTFFSDLEFTKGAQSVIVPTRSGVINQSVDGSINRFYPTASSSVSISPDGRLLALDDYSELVLWDLESDKLIDRLPARVSEFPSPVSGFGGTVAFSPDGRFLAMGTGIRFGSSFARSDLKVWDVTTRSEIRGPLFKNEVGITGVVFAPDNSLLVATDRNGVMRIWDTSTWELQNSFNGLPDGMSVDISQDGRWLAQGGRGIAIWDFQSLTGHHVLSEEKVWGAVEFTPDGRTLIVPGEDGRVLMWDVETGAALTSIDTGSEILVGCRVSSDGNKLGLTNWAQSIWVWDVASMQAIDQHPLTIDALAERGAAQNRNGNYDSAKQTLTQVLQTQLKLRTPDHDDVIATKSELEKSLWELGELPIILRQPTSTIVQPGDSVSLSVEVSNAELGNFHYQWYFSGEPLKDATEPSLVLSNVSKSDLGDYRVDVTCDNYASISVQSELAFLVGPDGVANGGLQKEFFSDIQGIQLADLRASPKFPRQPDENGALRSFEIPTNVDDNYGLRITGFIVPPETGDYVFYLCSDDSSELFLSHNEKPDNKKSIAWLDGWHRPREWETLNPDNISEPQFLEAGKRYWIEVHYKEGGGDDHCAITWQMPDHPPPKNGDPPISGAFLEFQLE